MARSLHDDRYVALVTALIDLRDRAGLTQQDVADRLGRPQSFVAKYETLQRRLDAIELVDVVLAIGSRFRHGNDVWSLAIVSKDRKSTT